MSGASLCSGPCTDEVTLAVTRDGLEVFGGRELRRDTGRRSERRDIERGVNVARVSSASSTAPGGPPRNDLPAEGRLIVVAVDVIHIEVDQLRLAQANP